MAQRMNPTPSPVPTCLLLSHPQERDSGDFLHRVRLPGQALARHLDVAEMQTSHPDFLRVALQVPLLVIKMIADPVLRDLMVSRAQRELPTVYEISDDFRDFPAHLPMHRFYAQPATQRLIESLASAAGLLQFSSHGLQQRYHTLNARTYVAMNQLESVPALPSLSPQRLSSPVLGWAGSVGHRDDARELAQHLKTWLAARPDGAAPLAPLRIMAAESLRSVFRDAGLDCEFVDPGSFDEYLRFLRSIDIGLASVAPTDFARGRSDGKYLEYASQGVVCVASAIGEYVRSIRSGHNGFLFADRQQFCAALDALVDQPALRLAVREQAHAQVADQRLHRVAVRDKLSAYRQALPGRWQTALREHSGGSLVSLIDGCEADWVRATRLHGQGQLPQALAIYLNLLPRCPAFHELWLRSAQIAQAMGARDDAEVFRQTGQSVLQAQWQQAGSEPGVVA
jgi:hypothetical protein